MNESMLTGESIPVIKQALPHNEKIFDSENDTKHILYSGTRCLETRKTKGTAMPVLGLVLQTGFSTMKGRLVRSLLFPKPENFQFYKDSLKFIGMMGIIAAMCNNVSIIMIF
jgi:cation-transporting ATPase 13A2